MKYTITGIKRTPISFTKRDGSAGVFTKVEVKTDKTADVVYELGAGHSLAFKDNAKVGDIVTGYTETVPWSKNGKSGVNLKLNGITTEYVYSLLLKLSPNIETVNAQQSIATPIETAGVPIDGWSTDASTDDSEAAVNW